MTNRFLEERRAGLSLLLTVTILLCSVVNVRLQLREQQRLEEQFAIIPPYQPETVWCTENGDLILLYTEHHPEGSAVIFTQQGMMREWELVLIAPGYFSFQKKDTLPVEAYLSGQFFMDDEATLRLVLAAGKHPLFEGQSELVLKRYFIADDNCPFFHVRIERID